MMNKNFLFLCFSVFVFFSLSLLPIEAKAEEEKISFDFKNVEIVELLRILSLKTGKTIVPSNQITGRITVFLNNISFKDVLDIILLSQNLAVEKKEDIYYIMTAAEYKVHFGKEYFEPRELKTIRLSYARPANVFNAISQLKSAIGTVIADEASGTIILIDIPEKLEVLEKTAKELDQPLQTVIFDLNYATAKDATTQLSAAITEGTGSVIVDERSSKAIISDLPGNMDKIRTLVREIDKETKQVFIEVDIVEVTFSDKLERGIDWEKVFGTRSLDRLDLVGNFGQTLDAYQRISVGQLSPNLYNVTLDFLETYGDVKIISQPRIAVVNNEEATILVGTRDAYISQTLSQAESTTVTSESIEFVDVGVQLAVTPTINEAGFIIMKIKPEVSSVAETIETSLGSRIPIVQTSVAETTVKVKDGTMIMIAGLRKETHENSVTGIPGLSRIPILGVLFGKRTKETALTELIVFITPYLTRGDVMLPGTEPEKVIPEDIMPDELKQEIAKKKKMEQAITEQLLPLEEMKPEEASKAQETRRAEVVQKIAEVEEPKAAPKIQELKLPEETEINQEVIVPEDIKGLEKIKLPAEVRRSETKQIEAVERPEAPMRISGVTKLTQTEALERKARQQKQKEEAFAGLEMEKSMLVAGAKEAIEAETAKQVEEAIKLIEAEKAKLTEEAKKLAEAQKLAEEAKKTEQAKKAEQVIDVGAIKIDEDEKIEQELEVELKKLEEREEEELIEEFEYTGLDSKLLKRVMTQYRRALEYQNLQKWDEAIGCYEKVIDMAASFVPAYNQLGIMFEVKELTDKAEEMYLKAIEINLDYAPAHANLAMLSEEKNDTQAAIKYWRKRVELGDPESVWTEKAWEHLRKLQN